MTPSPFEQPVSLQVAGAMPSLPNPFDEDETLDQVLRLVANHHGSLGVAIGRRAFSPSIAELRQSPLGRDLKTLTRAVACKTRPEDVVAAAERVRDVLLRPIASAGAAVPEWFWNTALGQIMARAERIALEPDGVLTVNQAATVLDAEPRQIETWIASGLLASLPGERDGVVIPREEVERMHSIALLFQPAANTDRVESIVVQREPERLTA